MSTTMSMELMSRKGRSSKMETRGMRTVRSRRKKHRERTENLNTATSWDMEKDKQKGRKEVVRERRLHTG